MDDDVNAALVQLLPRLRDWDDDTWQEHWDLVSDVVRRHEPLDVLAAAAAWCAGPDPTVQAAGLDLLGGLGVNLPAARDHLIVVADTLRHSGDSDVRWSLAVALGSNSTDSRTASALLALLRDDDEGVRFRATAGLSVPGQDEPEHGPVVDALLQALGDPCADVRDWAAFALGVQRDVDTEQVREALVGLLTDDEADTAGEAAVGLARRGDLRVLSLLLERLVDPQVGNLWVEAAASLGDERLLPSLLQLRAARWQDDDEPRPGVLDLAIERCSHGDDEPSS